MVKHGKQLILEENLVCYKIGDRMHQQERHSVCRKYGQGLSCHFHILSVPGDVFAYDQDKQIHFRHISQQCILTEFMLSSALFIFFKECNKISVYLLKIFWFNEN